MGLLYICRYRSRGHTADDRLSHTFYLLHDLMIFFDHYHAKEIDVAFEVCESHPSSGRILFPFSPAVTCSLFLSPSLCFVQVMRKLKLLPLAHGDSVEQKVAAFRTMDDAVSSVVVLCVGVSQGHHQFFISHTVHKLFCV